MKIYICTDLEGATGVLNFKQVNERGPEFTEAVKLLMGDVAAVVEGLREAGADEIHVLDGHNGGNNFIPEHMVPGVKYITGFPRQNKPLYGLDESFDGFILLGKHAMQGTHDGVLHHTQCAVTELKYYYDGVERGEIFQNAAVAGHFNVPLMLVTGDEATCREARATFGKNIPVVPVKKGISREAAVLLAPCDARRALKEGAIMAMKMLPELKPFKIKLPIKLVIKKAVPGATADGNIYFSERTLEVKSALDITKGTFTKGKSC